MADLTLVEPKTQKADLYPRLDVEEPGKGKSTLVSVKDKSGATLAELIVGKRRYDRLGAGNDGGDLRKPDDPPAWLARGSVQPPTDVSGWRHRPGLGISENAKCKR